METCIRIARILAFICAIITDNAIAQNTSVLDNEGMSSSMVDQTSQVVLGTLSTSVDTIGSEVAFAQSILSSTFPTTTPDVLSSSITSLGIQTTDQYVLPDSSSLSFEDITSVVSSSTAVAGKNGTSTVILSSSLSVTSVPTSTTVSEIQQTSSISSLNSIQATSLDTISASDSQPIAETSQISICINCGHSSSSETFRTGNNSIEPTVPTSVDTSILVTTTMNTTPAESFRTNYRSDYSISVNSRLTDMGTSLNNYSVNTPEQSQVSNGSNYSISDILLTQSTSYQGDSSLPYTTAGSRASSNVWQSSGLMSVSLVPSESVQYSISATHTITEGLENSSLISMSSLNGFTPDQVTSRTNFILSSSSSDYNLPGISTGTYSYQTTVLQTSGSTHIGSTSDILPSRSSHEFGQTATVVSAADEVIITTPIRTGVTSALDNMPSSSISTTENPRLADLQRQLNDYKDIESSYRIAVIVLSLIVALLIVLIVLYIFRRRKYYQEKQARLGGAIDDDLFDNQAHTRQKHFFKPQDSANLRISGRVSTASFGEDKAGEDEPMNLLGSFNRGRKSEDFKEETSNQDNTNNHKDVDL